MLMGISFILQVFSHNSKYLADWNLHLMMLIEEKLRDHKNDYNPSWGEISLELLRLFAQNHKCQPHDDADEKSGDHIIRQP